MAANKLFSVAFLIVMIFGLWLLPMYRYQINPDGISYISIGHEYARGEFSAAINGYWGPLLSWLIIPSFWLHINPIFCIKTIQVVTALGLMSLVYVFIKRIDRDSQAAAVGAAIIGCLSLEWALVEPLTPDLIVCFVFTLLVFKLVFYNNRVSDQIMIGSIGALLFFAKQAGLFLFLAVWVIWTMVSKFSQNEISLRQIIRRRLPSLTVFIILIMPFVTAISIKYHTPTIGTSGSYNFALVGPNSPWHPMFSQVLPPPNPSATSVWEDISNVPMPRWSPLESRKDFVFYFRLVKNNLNQESHYLAETILPFLVLGILYFMSRTRNLRDKQYRVLLLASSLLFISFYGLVLFEQRYIWFIIVASTMAFAGFLSRFKVRSFSFMFLAAISVLVIYNPIHALLHNEWIDKETRIEANSFKPYLDASSKVASDDYSAVFICYYTDSKFYSVISLSNSGYTRYKIQQYGIQYLVLAPRSYSKLKSMGISLDKVGHSQWQGENLYKLHP